MRSNPSVQVKEARFSKKVMFESCTHTWEFTSQTDILTVCTMRYLDLISNFSLYFWLIEPKPESVGKAGVLT